MWVLCALSSIVLGSLICLLIYSVKSLKLSCFAPLLFILLPFFSAILLLDIAGGNRSTAFICYLMTNKVLNQRVTVGINMSNMSWFFLTLTWGVWHQHTTTASPTTTP